MASIATVTVRDFAILEAKMPPPISIWLSSQPPKMSPLALVSAGIASVRMQRSPCGSSQVTQRGVNGLGVGHVGGVPRGRIEIGYLKLSQPASGVNRPPNFAASARSASTTFSGPRVRA